MENEPNQDTPALETLEWLDRDPLLKDIVPGAMSGAEMLDLYERAGVFRDYPEIGPGRKYADSTEYLLAMREEAAKQGRETE